MEHKIEQPKKWRGEDSPPLAASPCVSLWHKLGRHYIKVVYRPLFALQLELHSGRIDYFQGTGGTGRVNNDLRTRFLGRIRAMVFHRDESLGTICETIVPDAPGE